MKKNDDIYVAVIGLGYVGLPVANQFATKYKTYGFDIDDVRIKTIIKNKKFPLNKNLRLTANISDIKDCNFYIVILPTPIDKYNTPDLNILRNACNDLGKIIKKNDIIVFESTVYPGVTEEICAPIIAEASGLPLIKDKDGARSGGFFLGYSPERINPGDNKKTFERIDKIVSGSTLAVGKKIQIIYKSILKSKVHLVSSIKIAESAKIIENIQRDVNIALINELSILFNKLNLDTEEILKAAETKWNFGSYRPGLVGGHCIGVDPYYLTHKAQEIGLDTEIITTGRKINNSMSSYIAGNFLKLLKTKDILKNKPNVLILGFTFKENIDDIRNTKIMDLYDELKSYGCIIDIYDPLVDKKSVKKLYNLMLINKPKNHYYDGIIIAVKHQKFINLGINKIKNFGKKKSVLYDLKYIFKNKEVDGRL